MAVPGSSVANILTPEGVLACSLRAFDRYGLAPCGALMQRGMRAYRKGMLEMAMYRNRMDKIRRGDEQYQVKVCGEPGLVLEWGDVRENCK